MSTEISEYPWEGAKTCSLLRITSLNNRKEVLGFDTRFSQTCHFARWTRIFWLYHIFAFSKKNEKDIPGVPSRDFPIGALQNEPGGSEGSRAPHVSCMGCGPVVLKSGLMNNYFILLWEKILWLSKDTQTGCLMIIGTLWHRFLKWNTHKYPILGVISL